jgi:hypothetical protein
MPTMIGLEHRLQIGRILLDAARAASQAPQPVSTDEVEYIGMRNLNIHLSTASARLGQLRISPTPSPVNNPPDTPRSATPYARLISSGISSVRSSVFSEGLQARMNEGLVSTRRSPSAARSMRSPSVELGNEGSRQGPQSEQQVFARRATQHGKKH